MDGLQDCTSPMADAGVVRALARGFQAVCFSMFDLARVYAEAITGGESSMLALKGSTEEGQFADEVASV